MSESAIGRWAEAGRLTRVFHGVYSLSPVLAPLARELAAVYACGPTALVAGRSAAVMWGIRRGWDGPVDVVVLADGARRRDGIHIRRTQVALPRVIKDGVPVMTVRHTLLDLAAIDGERVIGDVNEALAKGLATHNELHALVAQSEGRRGVKHLRAALHQTSDGFTRSKAERVLKELIAQAGLPPAEHNAPIEGKERDAVWRHHRLVVEVDVYSTHGHPTAFEGDRRRDQDLTATGWRTVRITWRQLTDTPARVAATLTRALYPAP